MFVELAKFAAGWGLLIGLAFLSDRVNSRINARQTRRLFAGNREEKP